jgi:GT2 family glycosyltransferase
MITLNDFSFLIVTRNNNPKRLFGVYNSIRDLYKSNEIVIIYDDVAGSIKENVNDANLKEFITRERVYVAGGYNLAIKHSDSKCFVFLHDDTIVAPQFLENMLPHITENQFCNFTTIEPPLYNNVDSVVRPIKDFGRDIDTFDRNQFYEFCNIHMLNLKEDTAASPFGGFFMAGYKSSFDSIGGFDTYFKPYFYEDSDLMTRLHIAGYRFIQVLNSLVYHMGSLTSRSGDEGAISHSVTSKLFVKKWKTTFPIIQRYTMLGGIPYKSIPVEIECQDPTIELLEYLDLINEPGSSIKVKIDSKILNQQDFEYLESLPYVLQSIEESGTYQLGNLTITQYE